MPSYVPCKKNDANGFIFYISLVSQADTKIFQANPTLAAGDVKIAIDDGAPANLGTLPAVDADFTKRVKVVLAQAETNGDNFTIIFSDAAGSEWCDLTINIQTSAQTLDDVDTNVDSVLTDTGTTLQGELDGMQGTDGKCLISANAQDLSGTLDVNTKKYAGQVCTTSTGNLPDVNVAEISDDSEAANNCESEFDGTGYIHILRSTNVALNTTLNVRTSDSVFTIVAGQGNDDAYNNTVLALYDVSGTAWEVRRITDYTGATKTVTVDTAFTFTVANGDYVRIFQNAYAPTVAAGATAQAVWEYNVSAITADGFAGTYQNQSADSHLHR